MSEKPSIQETVKHFDRVWPGEKTDVILWLPQSERYLVVGAIDANPYKRVCTYSEFAAIAGQQEAA